MDCARMRTWALAGGDLAAPEAKQHLDACEACRAIYAEGAALARALDQAQPPTAPPSFADLEAQLVDAGGGRGRLDDLPSRLRWAVALAALALPIVAGVIRHRHNLAAYPVARLSIELGALLALVLAGCWVWLRPLYKPQPGHRFLWTVVGLSLVVPWLLAVWPASLPADAARLAPGAAGDLQRAANCFGYGTLTALPALLLVAGLGRRQTGYPGFGLLPATAAALAGLFGLALHCPEATSSHLLMGHAPIAWALPLLLVLLRRRPRRAIAARRA